MTNRTMGIPALEDRLFVKIMIFDYLYIEIGDAGYRSVYRERWSYELNLLAESALRWTLICKRWALHILYFRNRMSLVSGYVSFYA